MGMFDSFYFAKGALPDNPFSPDEEFQTKCLACNMDVYRVDENKKVKRYSVEVWPDRNSEIEVFGVINESAYVSGFGNNGRVDYKILIYNSELVYADKLGGEQK